MSDWIKCSERLPDIEGKILTLIADKIFVGECYKKRTGFYLKILGDEVDFEMGKRQYSPLLEVEYIETGDGWVKQSHFKDPEYWMPLPELPKD